MKFRLIFVALALIGFVGPGATALRAYTFQDSIPPAQYNALVDLYNSTTGASWLTKTGWLNPAASAWFGVTVSGVVTDGGGNVTQTGNVIGVSLVSNNMNGTIPAAIGQLTGLKNLQMASNPQLSGSIPDTIGNLTALQFLALWGNGLTGALPSSVGNLTQLIDLDVSTNALSSQIPATIGNLGQLEYLALYLNQFTGSIPSEFGNLASLTTCYVDGNALTGPVPSSLGNLTALEDFTCYDNFIDGVLPASLVGLPALAFCYVEDNLLNVEPTSQSRAVLNALSANATDVSFSPQRTGYTTYSTRFSGFPPGLLTAFNVSFEEPITLTASGNRALAGEVTTSTANVTLSPATFSIASAGGSTTVGVQVHVAGLPIGNHSVNVRASGGAAFSGNYAIVALLGGTVTDNASAALPGVDLTLTAPGGSMRNLTTTASGELVLTSNGSRILPLAETGNWAVTAQKTGYKPANGTFNVTGTTATVSLVWMLQPLASPDPAAGPVVSNPPVSVFLPVITSNLTGNGVAGTPFNYAITATLSPEFFTASPLPAGLSLNGTTGVLSGTPAGTGTFPIALGARNPAGVGTANLTLTIEPALTGLQQWRQLHFGNTSNTGPGEDTADPDRGGKPNLVEYAVNTDPLVPDQIRVPTVTTDAGRLTLIFQRDTSKSDLMFEVESSGNLTGWTVIARSTGGGAMADVGSLSGGVGETGNGTYREVTVRDGFLISSQPGRQVRLKISGN